MTPRVYVPRWFRIEELFPRSMVEAHPPARLWATLDPRIMPTLDLMRDRWGPLIVNDWLWGGRVSHRGWRPEGGPGAALSQHRWGRAVDLHSRRMSADDMRADILAHPDDPAFEHVSRIEDGRAATTWLHWDCGIVLREKGRGIIVFMP